jgi:NhaA family Na+:H+ antiporter
MPTDESHPLLKSEPIDRLVNPLVRFLHVEIAGGVALLAATAAALLLANSPLAAAADHFWMTPLGIDAGSFQLRMTLEHWIDDGLMTIFFFVVGLEVKRELVLGELRDVRRAMLPIAAAIGGMIAPACIYLALQQGQPGQRGWGIPMATDIAFVVGCMAILGRRVPHGLRVMVLSLAIVDDIGAILVIAVGYSNGIRMAWLAAGLLGIVAVYGCTKLGIRRNRVYVVLGCLIWLAFYRSGVHAAIVGVVLGLMTPARSYVSPQRFTRILQRAMELLGRGGWETEPQRAEKVRRFQWAARETIPPLEYLEATLHPWVALAIMPIFALANAGVEIHATDLGKPVAVAVMLGLLLGKPAGIVLASFLAVKAGWARLPEHVGWAMITAGGALSGIGFTMALFIGSLAFEGEPLAMAKIGVLVGSLLSAVAGSILIALFARRAHDGPR